MVPPLHVLEQNGMRIETDHEKIKPLPPYAEELRELLLNFQGIIPLMQVCFASCPSLSIVEDGS